MSSSNQPVACYFFTDLSGAGKFTLANHLYQQINKRNIPVIVLDGDQLCNRLNADLDFSLDGGSYVFLMSALVDVTDDEQVRFVIGHELGHIAAGHLDTIANFVKYPAFFTPFLGKAYSRAREYTCDAIGAHLSNNEKASCQALQLLGCGCKRFSLAIDTQAFAAQEQLVPPMSGFIHEILSTHPRLTRRVLAIINRKRSSPFEVANTSAYKMEPSATLTQNSRPKGFADV